MAYDRQKLYEEAVLAITEDKNIVFEYEVYDSLGIGKTTFYGLFEQDSNEMNTIKRLLRANKSLIKKDLRKEFSMGSSAEKIALYKLLGETEELERLNGQHIDHTSKGESIKITPISFNDNAKND